jgi:hypothetical protein
MKLCNAFFEVLEAILDLMQGVANLDKGGFEFLFAILAIVVAFFIIFRAFNPDVVNRAEQNQRLYEQNKPTLPQEPINPLLLMFIILAGLVIMGSAC